MADRYVFADEAGNFDFSRRSGASRYFILCTVSAAHCEIGDSLLSLRRDLGWRGLHLDRVFHATEDPQAVRDEVFDLLGEMDCSIDATVLEKSKAQPHLKDICISKSWRRTCLSLIAYLSPHRALVPKKTVMLSTRP